MTREEGGALERGKRGSPEGTEGEIEGE